MNPGSSKVSEGNGGEQGGCYMFEWSRRTEERKIRLYHLLFPILLATPDHWI